MWSFTAPTTYASLLTSCMMYPDTVVPVVDAGTLVVYLYVDRHLRSWALTRDGDGRSWR